MLGLIRNGEFNLGLADDPVIEAGDRLLVAEAGRAPSRSAGSSAWGAKHGTVPDDGFDLEL